MNLPDFILYAILGIANLLIAKSKNNVWPAFSYVVAGMCIVRAVDALIGGAL